MGNIESTFLRVCGSAIKRKKDPIGENTVEQSSNFIERNRDNYFQKDDYNRIVSKFPEFNNWMEQSQQSHRPSVKPEQKQKRIRWKEGGVLGQGSFGKVIMGFNIENGMMMAVKQVQIAANNTTAQQERIQALEVEIELLSQFNHQNIVKYYGSERTQDTFNIFLEYISGGTIASRLETYGPFTENLIKVYTIHILQGLEYLHVRNTIHRDIKGANILIDSNVCKLTDFGTAKRISSIVESDTKYIPSIRGTVNWMAPEVMRQSALGRFCDIWSVGCTVIEMATGKAPWAQLLNADANCLSLMYQIAQAKSPPPIPKDLSPDAIDFLKQCFKINPQERPNVIKLLNHKFLANVEIYKQIDLPQEEKRPLSAKIQKDDSPGLSKLFKTKDKNKTSRFASKNKSVSGNTLDSITKEDKPILLPEGLSTNGEDSVSSKAENTTKGKGSLYNFDSVFPGQDTKPDNFSTKMKENTPKARVNTPKSGGRIQKYKESRRTSLAKDLNEDESRFGHQVASLGFGQTDKSDSESLGTIKSVTDGQRTLNALQDDGGEMDNTMRRKTRQRPLGRNNRLAFKSGYANLSEEDSIAGNSFMVNGSPGTILEISEVQESNASSAKGNNNGAKRTAFHWPENIDQIREQGGLQDDTDWDVTHGGKIEEEAKENEESRYEKDKVIFELEREDDRHQDLEGIQIELGEHDDAKSHDSDREVEKDASLNDISVGSVHSNPPVRTMDVLEEKGEHETYNRDSGPFHYGNHVKELPDQPKSITNLYERQGAGKSNEVAPRYNHSNNINIKPFRPEINSAYNGLTVVKTNSSPSIRTDYKVNVNGVDWRNAPREDVNERMEAQKGRGYDQAGYPINRHKRVSSDQRIQRIQAEKEPEKLNLFEEMNKIYERVDATELHHNREISPISRE